MCLHVAWASTMLLQCCCILARPLTHHMQTCCQDTLPGKCCTRILRHTGLIIDGCERCSLTCCQYGCNDCKACYTFPAENRQLHLLELALLCCTPLFSDLIQSCGRLESNMCSLACGQWLRRLQRLAIRCIGNFASLILLAFVQ
jgi:hypothetical protein